MQFFILDLLLEVVPVLVFLFLLPVIAKRILQEYYGARAAALLFEKKLKTENEKSDFSDFTADPKHFS